jgi:hypothetical protein
MLTWKLLGPFCIQRLIYCDLNIIQTTPQPMYPLLDFLKLLGCHPPLILLPPSVLAIAPHLAKLSKADSLDDHLHKTWELRQAFSSEKATDPIINLMQSQPLQEPTYPSFNLV